MDIELRGALAKAGQAEETIDFLEKAGCLNRSVFCEWVDEPDDWAALVQTMSTSDVPGESPRIKAAWKQTMINKSQRMKRESESLAHTFRPPPSIGT